MKREEFIIKQYLEHKGFQDIKYEPDGNIPPDFLVDGRIAVEVRRLNQHINDKGESFVPLEKLEYSLIPRIHKLINEFSCENFEYTSFVSIIYSRPLVCDRLIIQQVNKILEKHLRYLHQRKLYEVCDGLKLEFIPSSEKLENVYSLGGDMDLDEGGFLIPNIIKNLQIVIAEKANKIEPHRKKYSVWWLALVDHITYGSLESQYIGQVNKLIGQKFSWNKILLVAPEDPSDAIEI
jgi:hypothetical protein